MTQEKALNLVRTIFDSHRETLGVEDPRSLEVLAAAQTDVTELVKLIFDECADGDFDDYVEDSIRMTRAD
jgi:hypothetical protein